MTASIGTTATGDPLEIDLDRLIGAHACIVANSGGGKSGLIRRLLEATHGRVQHVVLDGEDEFYTLRERYEYVIAGGDGADVPATVAGAGGLADAALRHGFSLIAQLNDLGPDGAREFVGAFLEALIAAPRDLWRPMLVVIDEAQRYVPLQGATAASHSVKALTAQGRKRGFTAILASQRISKLSPDVRGDVNNWLLGRTGQTIDRSATADALGFSATEARDRLRSAEPRMFWGYGPAIAAEPTLFRVDDVETTPVRPGQAKIPTPPAPEALRSILAGLATAPKAALHIDDNIPTEPGDAYAGGSAVGQALKERDARIAELEAQLARHQAGIDTIVEAIGIFGDAHDRAVELIQSAIANLHSADAVSPSADAPDLAPLEVPVARGGGEAAKNVAASPTVRGEVHLPPRRIRLLESVQKARALLKTDAPSRAVVAWLAGTSPSSSTFEKDCSALRTAGLIEYPAAGAISLLPAASPFAGPKPPKMTRDALREAIAAQLPPRRDRILRALWEGPELSRVKLAQLSGTVASSSTFEKDLSAMKTLGLITYPGRGQVALAGICR